MIENAMLRRKWLGHTVPSWGAHGIFFVTINCRHRNGNDLVAEEAVDVVKSAALHYHGSRWWIHLWMTMPDHIHALLSFPRDESMVKVVADWKRFVARKAGIEWQKGFFDHRLRRDESFEEKAHYIHMNPVRKGLVESPAAWPHVLSFDGRDGSPSRPNSAERASKQGQDGRLGEASLPRASLPDLSADKMGVKNKTQALSGIQARRDEIGEG